MISEQIPHDEVQRFEALLAYHVLHTAPEPGFDRIASLAARFCQTPIAFISFMGKTTQWIKSYVDVAGISPTARSHSFCSHDILSDEVLVVPDVLLDPRFSDSPYVTGPPHIRFYAGCPLLTAAGQNLGTLCVVDTEPRTLTPDMIEALQDLAASVMDKLELRRCGMERDSRSQIVEGLISDITESKQKEEALSEAVQVSEQANQAKTEFLSRMSHEFRTPMNAILGFAQMLEMAPLAPDFQEDLAQVKKAGEHLLGLINEVLDLSAVHANRVPLSMNSVPLGELLADTIGLLRPLLEESDVSVLPISQDGEACVLADRHRLKQVLINLVSNAIKYNRRGGTITLKTRREEGWVILDITDQGAGISVDKLNRLFTPFDRLDAEETGIEGTGLGLTISRGLIELMGGSVSVSSEEGEGSTFTVRLPEVADSQATLDHLRDRRWQEIAWAGRHEILYIEDNESNILLVRRILSAQPELRLTVSRSLATGLQRLTESQPDLLLLDLNLPDGSGEAVVKWVRTESNFHRIPIIVLTADATPWQQERILAAGADHYLTKPINVMLFRKVVSDLIRERTK